MMRALGLSVAALLALAAFRFPSGDIPVTPSAGAGNSNVTFPLAGPADAATAPDYSFAASPGTGMFSPAANICAASASGSEVMRWSAAGAVLATGKQLQCASGTAAAPCLSFSAAPDRGFFSDGTNNGIGVAVLGAQLGYFSSAGLVLGANKSVLLAAGSAAAPSYAFAGSPSTGLYYDNPNALLSASLQGNVVLALGAGGAVVPALSSNGNVAVGGSLSVAKQTTLGGLVAGTTSVAGLTTSAAANLASAAVAGSLSVVGPSQLAGVQAAAGTAASPGYAFAASTNTGAFFDNGNNTLSLASQGNAVVRISGNDGGVGGSVTLQQPNFYDGASPLLRFGGSNQALLGYADGLWVRTGDGTTASTLKAKNVYTTGSDATSGDALSGWNGHVAAGASKAFRFYGSTRITDIADGILQLLNNANSGFSKLYFGPYTASFPMLKVNGGGLLLRLGDDSGDASLGVGSVNASGNVAVTGTLGVTGTATVSKVQNANGTAAAPTYSYTSAQGMGWYVEPALGLAEAVSGARGWYFTPSAELAMDLTPTGGNNRLRFGAKDATGVTVFKGSSGVIQFGLADDSGNAMARARQWQTTNLDGSTQFGTNISSDLTGLRLYYDTSASIANDYATVIQQRGYTKQKTAAYTVTKADTNFRITNKAATVQVVLTLPAATGVGTFTTSADVIVLTFTNLTATGIQIKAAGTDVIQFPGSASSAGGTQSTTTVGASATLFVCDTGTWCVEGAVGGTWTGA